MLFDAVTELQLFVEVFLGVYTLAIFAYIITSWIQLPYSLRPIQTFLHDVCEPYLRLWRRLLPMRGPLDFSPMLALIGLIALEQILVRVLDQFH